MLTRVLPFLPNPGSPMAKQMFHVEPGEVHNPPPGHGGQGDSSHDDQQHPAAAHELEHGHPKR